MNNMAMAMDNRNIFYNKYRTDRTLILGKVAEEIKVSVLNNVAIGS